MSDSVQPQVTDDLLDQACEWVVRLRAEKVANSDLEQFADWVTSSDQHRSAFDRIAEMWGELGITDNLPVNELPVPEPAQAPRQSRFAQWFSWPALGGVAAAALLAVAGLLMVSSSPDLDNYHTAVGEHLQITLDDGSQVDLNTNSELQVRYEGDQRWLQLVRGEAYFSVAKDSLRPFIVELNGVSAQALGTEFNIHTKPANRRRKLPSPKAPYRSPMQTAPACRRYWKRTRPLPIPAKAACSKFVPQIARRPLSPGFKTRSYLKTPLCNR